MVHKLVIHLGDSKTGSTSIQSVLSEHLLESRTHSICYPARFNHVRLAETLYQRSQRPFKDSRFSSVARKLNQSEAEIGVISAENFEFCDPALLSEAINDYFPEHKNSVQLIAYVRPHASRILSSFAQQIKRGVFDGSLDQFCHYFFHEKKRIHYAERCQNWKNIFGERYIVRPMIPSLLENNDVVSDFLLLCLGDRHFTVRTSDYKKKSLTLEDLSILKYIHSKVRSIDGGHAFAHQRFGGHFAEILSKFPSDTSTKLAFHSKCFERFQEMVNDDIDQSDKMHFSEFDSPMRAAMIQAGEKLVSKPQSLEILDHFEANTIRIVDCWIELIKIMSDNDPQNFQKIIRRPTRQ